MLPCVLPGEHNISRKGTSWYSEAKKGSLPDKRELCSVYYIHLQLWEALSVQINSDNSQALRQVFDSKRFQQSFLPECAKARFKEGSLKHSVVKVVQVLHNNILVMKLSETFNVRI